jgi:AcrR family transcriptional regulator
MAERKRPRRTRERILETGLALFNRFGAPNVTTADIADEMDISPGNLYYHFRNKDDIIGELAARYEATLAPLLAVPRGGPADVEDVWLLLHVLFERMGTYRFLYRDLDQLTSRNRKLAWRLGGLAQRTAAAVAALCEGMGASGAMRASAGEIAALSQNVALVATYWMSFERLARGPDAAPDELDPGRAAYQAMATIAPYLVGDARALLDRLGADYL